MEDINLNGVRMVNSKIKNALYELADKKCEICHKEIDIDETNIHRIRRGHQGGTYHWRNCQVLCTNCHKLIHGGEFN